MKKAYIYSIIFLIPLVSCSSLDILTPSADSASGFILETSAEALPAYANLDGVECIPDLNSVEEAVVLRVIDGDSIEVSINGQPYQVRYIGINTPEYYSRQRPAAITATQANQKLVGGRTIYLFKDQSETDKYGRLLRYVLTDEAFVNLELVRGGYAEARPYPPDTACQAVFEAVLN